MFGGMPISLRGVLVGRLRRPCLARQQLKRRSPALTPRLRPLGLR